MKYLLALLAFLSFAQPLWALDYFGKWESRRTPGMTMTIEPLGTEGRRITYHMTINNKPLVMIVETPTLNGVDVPTMVEGKPTGETMAITRLDDRHYTAVVKLNGQPFGTSKGELSLDGKTITVENDYTTGGGGNPAGKYTEVWERK